MTESKPAVTDVRKPLTGDSIRVRQLSHYQFSWVAGEAGQDGTWTLQLVLDQGAWEEVIPPVTAAFSAIAVIECKQYRRGSPTNFSSALRNYAAGHPNARVLLANYGPADSTILNRVPTADRDRCVLLPYLRPDNSSEKERLRTELRQALDLGPVQVSVPAGGNA